MTGNPAVTVLATPAECARVAAALLVDQARRAVVARGEFAVVLAGGSTPGAMYRELASSESLRSAVDWHATHVFWGDERAVPPDHPDSNYRGARTLLDAVAIPPEQVHRIEGEVGAEEAARRYRSRLAAWQERRGALPLFDLVLLGLGDDGHTASLFPGGAVIPGLAGASRAPVPPTERVTLSFEALGQAGLIVFVATGAAKAPAVAAAIEGGPDPDTPASMVRSRSGMIRWVLDAAAAARLANRPSGPGWPG